MSKLSKFQWNIDNLRLSFFFKENIYTKYFENQTDDFHKGLLKSILDIRPEMTVNESLGRFLEIGSFSESTKIELHCNLNRIDLRLVYLEEEEKHIELIYEELNQFIDKVKVILEKFEDENLFRIALGLQLKIITSSSENSLDIFKIINPLTNINKNYENIELRYNIKENIRNGENSLLVNNIVAIATLQEIFTEDPNGGFMSIPKANIRNVCTYLMDVNTDSDNLNNITDSDIVIESILKIINTNIYKD